MFVPSEYTGLCFQIIAGSAASLGSMVSSSIFGWLNPIYPYLLGPDSEIPMSIEEASWMTVMPEFGNLVSPLPAGYLADHYGRKLMILSSAPIFLIGWIIILYFKTFFALNVARFIQGLAIGIVYTVVPIYLGEIASPKYRGAITSIFFSFSWANYLFEYAIGSYFSFKTFTWITASLNVVFFISFLFQPESPYYYLMKNDSKNAHKSLSWFQQTTQDEVNKELERMKQSVEEDQKKKVTWFELLAIPIERKALMILLFVGFLRQCNGIIGMALYSTETLNAAGDNFFISPQDITVVMGVMTLIGSLCGFFTLDIFGRKPLLFFSCLISGVAMFATGTYYFLKSHISLDVSQFSWVPPISILVLAAVSVVGIFPVNTAYGSELFTSTTRGTVSGLFSIYTTFLGICVLKYYLTLMVHFGLYLNFYIFTFVCVLGTFSTFFGLPETKGKTFEQIRRELANSCSGAPGI